MLWPTTISVPSRDYFKQKYVKPQIRTEFENGTVQSRPKFTKGRWVFELGWKILPHSEYITLQTFFHENQGKVFDWPHPITNEYHTVRFAQDELPSASPVCVYGGQTQWQLSGLVLEEV